MIVAMVTTTNMPEGDEDDTNLSSTFIQVFRVYIDDDGGEDF